MFVCLLKIKFIVFFFLLNFLLFWWKKLMNYFYWIFLNNREIKIIFSRSSPSLSFVNFWLESTLFIYLWLELLFCRNLPFIYWHLQISLWRGLYNFFTLFIYFWCKTIPLLNLSLLNLPLLFLRIPQHPLFPFQHLLIKLIRRPCTLICRLLCFHKLLHKHLILLLLLLFFKLLMKLYSFIFCLDKFLISLLDWLMLTHLLYDLLWLFVDSGMEFKLFLFSL